MAELYKVKSVKPSGDIEALRTLRGAVCYYRGVLVTDAHLDADPSSLPSDLRSFIDFCYRLSRGSV